MYRHPSLPSTQRLAALTVDLGPAAPVEVRLLPAGRFRASDGSGRPEGVGHWELTEEGAAALVAQAQARQSDYVIDFEHQTLAAAQNGRPAPAAGWFRRLEARADGLYATGVQWTAEATALIAGRQYRYISPVFAWDRKTGRVERLYHAGLTNNPGLDGLTDLAALTAIPFDEENPVDPKKITALLGLAADASEEQTLAALAALKAQADTGVAALKAAAPDPAKFIGIEAFEALKGQLAALSARTQAQEVDDLVKAALAAGGNLLPAQEAWARELGTKDVAALIAYLAATPAIAALGGTQTGGKPPAGDGKPALDASELAVCKALGVSADDYVKSKGSN